MTAAVAISLFDNHFAREAFTIAIEPLKGLVNFIEMRGAKRSILPKAKLPLWSPASYEPRAMRLKANVRYVSCMVFDVDNGLPFAAHALFSDYRYYAHTTASHSDELNKWRLVLPLLHPIKGDVWTRAWQAGADLFQERTGTQIDPACKNPDRMYYVAQPNAITFDHLGTEKTQRAFYDIDMRKLPKPKRKKKVVCYTGRKAVTSRSSENKVRDSLMNDPAARMAAATALGAQIVDTLARRITCPACSRADVWFLIEPDDKKTASCNHKNSCGWYGQIYDLLNM